MKKFIEVGYNIFYLGEKEIELLNQLSKKNLLKFTPKEIKVYGYEEKGDNEYTLHKGDFWEELIAPSGKVVCGNHRLNATEILDALGIQYTEEELESDEEEDQSSSFSIPAPRQRLSGAVFHYTTTSTNLSSEK